MRNAFITGLIAGIAGMLAAAYVAPFLSQDRIRGETRVQTNGGRLEVFEVRTAADALLQAPGLQGDLEILPNDTAWYPELAPFIGDASVYRLRNESGRVIGVASRVRAMRGSDDVEWILHIPARGTLALTGVSVDNAEVGELRVGTEEFVELSGDWQAELDANGTWRISTSVRARTPGDEKPDEAAEAEAEVQP